MLVSVIIVSYNAADYLKKCLQSVQTHLPPNSEVIVWDNASPERAIENLLEAFPKVKFILHDKNLGFSKANNAAVAIAQGKYVLILNPDTILYDGFFDKLLNFAHHHPKTGAIGVRMVDGENRFLPESKRNLPNAINSFSKLFGNFFTGKNGYYNTALDEKENGKVEILTGACMFLQKKVYEEVGGFDERYFMYGEDIDLSYTLLQHGYQNYYLGEIYITHFKGESTIKDVKYLDRFYGAMEIFITKYYKKQRPIQFMILYAGLQLKYHLEKLKLNS